MLLTETSYILTSRTECPEVLFCTAGKSDSQLFYCHVCGIALIMELQKENDQQIILFHWILLFTLVEMTKDGLYEVFE